MQDWTVEHALPRGKLVIDHWMFPPWEGRVHVGKWYDVYGAVFVAHAFPVSSATISAWRGRTSPGLSSSSSGVFPMRPPAAPTFSLPDGLTDSTVPRVDLTARRRCRKGCSGSARRAVIRSRSQPGLCSTRRGPQSIFGSGPPI